MICDKHLRSFCLYLDTRNCEEEKLFSSFHLYEKQTGKQSLIVAWHEFIIIFYIKNILILLLVYKFSLYCHSLVVQLVWEYNRLSTNTMHHWWYAVLKSIFGWITRSVIQIKKLYVSSMKRKSYRRFLWMTTMFIYFLFFNRISSIHDLRALL